MKKTEKATQTWKLQEQLGVIICDVMYVTYPVLYTCVTKIYIFFDSDSFKGRKNILIRAEGKLWVFLMIVMRLNAVLDWIKHVCFQPALWLTVSAALFFAAVYVFTAWVFAALNSSITSLMLLWFRRFTWEWDCKLTWAPCVKRRQTKTIRTKRGNWINIVDTVSWSRPPF